MASLVGPRAAVATMVPYPKYIGYDAKIVKFRNIFFFLTKHRTSGPEDFDRHHHRNTWDTMQNLSNFEIKFFLTYRQVGEVGTKCNEKSPLTDAY